jgi:hypothetical protein
MAGMEMLMIGLTVALGVTTWLLFRVAAALQVKK